MSEFNISRNEILDKIKQSYSHYYTFIENNLAPFNAIAEFHSKNSQYFLLKSATLAEEELNEYVYFVSLDTLDLSALKVIEKTAWENGLSKVEPHSNHRCSDITVIIIAESVSNEAKEYIKKIKLTKRYKFTFFGWSYFRILALDMSSNKIFNNNKAKDLRKLIQNINLKR